MKLIMDADCLIKLTKAKLKELLCNNFSVFIPETVKKKTYVGHLYRQGNVTLREAANLLNTNQIEVMNLFLDEGIKGNLEASDVLVSLERFVTN